MAQDSTVFSGEQHHPLIDSILDQLIPASSDGKIPAAGALGIASFLARVASADSETAKILEYGFNRVNELLSAGKEAFDDLSEHGRIEFLKKIQQQEPEFFSVLLRYTYMGYYSRPEIRPLFGLSSRPTQPDGYEVPVESPGEMSSLTRTVKERGQCFRKC